MSRALDYQRMVSVRGKSQVEKELKIPEIPRIKILFLKYASPRLGIRGSPPIPGGCLRKERCVLMQDRGGIDG